MFRILAGLLMACLALAAHARTADAPEPLVKDLGNGQMQIGEIQVDRNAGSFTVPGRVLAQDTVEAPMEFIAVTKGGMKSYEAVLELDTTAVNFNLACILLGLDESQATRPKYHFDPEPTRGQPVALTVSFSRNGKQHSLPVEQLLASAADAGPHRWVYTGSSFTPDGRYLAEAAGTLIGVVHDPESIIQHQRGLGLGNYGEMVRNLDVVPGAGTPVVITLQKL